MKVALVINSGSRAAKEHAAVLPVMLEKAGAEVTVCHLADSPDKFRAALKDAVANGPDIVAVGGGDGTLGMAAGTLRGSKTPMAVLPLGTGNQFAKELGIKDLESAVATVTGGETFECDVAMLNGQPFVTVASIGLSTDAANSLFAKQLVGKLAYIPAWIKAVARAKRFCYRVESDGRVVEGEAVQIVIGNGRSHAGPLWTHSQASVTDGHLNGYIVGPINAVQGLAAAGLSFVGQQALLKSVTSLRAKELTLTTDPAMRVAVDGEIERHDVLRFTIEPGALLLRRPSSVAQDETGAD